MKKKEKQARGSPKKKITVSGGMCSSVLSPCNALRTLDGPKIDGNRRRWIGVSGISTFFLDLSVSEHVLRPSSRTLVSGIHSSIYYSHYCYVLLLLLFYLGNKQDNIPAAAKHQRFQADLFTVHTLINLGST